MQFRNYVFFRRKRPKQTVTRCAYRKKTGNNKKSLKGVRPVYHCKSKTATYSIVVIAISNSSNFNAQHALYVFQAMMQACIHWIRSKVLLLKQNIEESD
jgi:hypothetical protein